MKWSAYCGQCGLLPGTIRNYLTGLRSAHIDYGYGALDAFYDDRVQREVDGIRRLRGEAERKEREPVRREILLKILRTLNTSSLFGATMHAAWCLAFAAFLRLGEITYTSSDIAADFASWHVTRRSVTLHQDHMELSLPSSKTDPFRRGINLLISAAGDEACAVRSVHRLLTQFPAPLSAPLFFTSSDPFTKQQVIGTLRSALAQVGIKPGHYSGHSFRRGAATSAKDAGLTDSEIQMLGRWKSSSYRLYIDTHPSHILRASRRLQRDPLVVDGPPSLAPS